MPIPILLDTDIGSDIDDALALAYLLRQPECEILGITTVSGQSGRRAALASALCRESGRQDIPILAGAERPLIVPQKQADAPQAEALASDDQKEFRADTNAAVALLRNSIRARPGEITLLTIGPLTNIALLLSIDPGVAGLIKRVVCMAGWYFNSPQPEWNVRCDPHAAAIVFGSDVPDIVAVGIDVTDPCRMPAEDCRMRFGSSMALSNLVSKMADIWFRGKSVLRFHDPLAAAILFEPDICSYVDRVISVDIWDNDRLGKTDAVEYEGHVRRIASRVDVARFFDHYFDIVARQPDTTNPPA